MWGGLVLKVIAHPFWKEETMQIKYWLDSSHRSRQPRSERATWGSASVRAGLRRQHGEGAAAAGRRTAAVGMFRVGRETENNAFTQHSY